MNKMMRFCNKIMESAMRAPIRRCPAEPEKKG
jgi:hypothetical protein